jgi:hypothetical protein
VLSDAQGELGELGELGDVQLHYFSFGGLVATARYAQEKAGANTAPAIASSR